MRNKFYKVDGDDKSGPRWLPYLLYLIITFVLAIPILKNFANWGVRDWDLFTTLNAAAVDAILKYGQFPFWNPFWGWLVFTNCHAGSGSVTGRPWYLLSFIC